MDAVPPPIRVRVFVSYSHADVQWLRRLQVHLAPLKRNFSTDIWDDTRIKPGSDWRSEIRASLEASNVAILLLSADFLASEFIATNELPPLIEAAEKRGLLVLPVILSPSLFRETPELSKFQSINEPSRPVISLEKGEQEDVFLRVAEALLRKQQEMNLAESEIPKPAVRKGANRMMLREDFVDRTHRNFLLRLGDWFSLKPDSPIIGSGMNAYLLSQQSYGRVPFRIEARLAFSNDKNDFNAGIIIGWDSPKANPRYLNCLITGSQLLLERIGFNGRPAGSDYEHLNHGAPFQIRDGEPVSLAVDVTAEKISVWSGTTLLWDYDSPERIGGRVGLRPWRSHVTVRAFSVFESSET